MVKVRICIQKWLERILLMMSYLDAIATDCRWNLITMCLKDKRTATENGVN